MMGTDFDTLADRIAADLNIETSAARIGLNTYIEQMEDVDGREIGRESIGDDDADFLITAYREGMKAQGLA